MAKVAVLWTTSGGERGRATLARCRARVRVWPGRCDAQRMDHSPQNTFTHPVVHAYVGGHRPGVGGWASPAPRVIRNTGEDSDSVKEMSKLFPGHSQRRFACLGRGGLGMQNDLVPSI